MASGKHVASGHHPVGGAEMTTIVLTDDRPPLPEWGSGISVTRPAQLVPRRDSMHSVRRESIFSALGWPRAMGRIDVEVLEEHRHATGYGLFATAALVLVFCAVPAFVTAGLIGVTFDEACFQDDEPVARYALSVGSGTCAGLIPACLLWLAGARWLWVGHRVPAPESTSPAANSPAAVKTSPI